MFSSKHTTSQHFQAFLIKHNECRAYLVTVPFHLILAVCLGQNQNFPEQNIFFCARNETKKLMFICGKDEE